MILTVTIPIQLKNPSNGSQFNRWARIRDRKEQRSIVPLTFASHSKPLAKKYSITMTRLANSKGLDFDGLVSSLKSIRDGISDWLGFKDDSDPRLNWVYSQERAKSFGVRIEIEAIDEGK